MKGIVKAEDLPQNTEVYLKKDIFGWRVVHPWKKDNGQINWFPFLTGGWRNLIFTIILVLFVLGFVWAYSHDVNKIKGQYKTISEDPISFCTGLYGPTASQQNQNDFYNKVKGWDVGNLSV